MTTQTIRKILTRDFILGSSAQFIFMMAFYILVPTLPIYLARSKANETEIGFLVGIFFVSALVFRPFVGKALQKIPEKTFMIAGALLFALTSFAYLLAPPFWPFLIVRIFQGIALALFHTASFTLIANISPKAHWGESFSYFFLASNFSLALAPPLGMFIVNRSNFSVLFLICLGASLCSLCIAAKLGRKQVAPLNPSPTGKDSFLNSKAVPPSIISFFTMITWGALTAFFPLYALDHGVSDPGLFYTCGREIRVRSIRPAYADSIRLLFEAFFRKFLPKDVSLQGRIVGWTSSTGLIFGNFNQPGTCRINTPRGCNMAVRKAAFAAIGGFNGFFRGNAWGFEAEFGLRMARAGEYGRFLGDAAVLHYEVPAGGLPKSNDIPAPPETVSTYRESDVPGAVESRSCVEAFDPSHDFNAPGKKSPHPSLQERRMSRSFEESACGPPGESSREYVAATKCPNS